MTPEHVLVFYDKVTLEPRIIVVNEDGEDGSWLLNGTDAPDGMGRAVIAKSEVRGKPFHGMAAAAISKKLNK